MKAKLKFKNGKEIEVTVKDNDFGLNGAELRDNVFKQETYTKERTYDDGKPFWIVTSEDSTTTCIYAANGLDYIKNHFKNGNFFNSRKEAEMDALRTKGMRVKSTAIRYNSFWYWDFKEAKAKRLPHWNWNNFLMEKKFATEKECQEWGDEFSVAFEYFNK